MTATDSAVIGFTSVCCIEVTGSRHGSWQSVCSVLLFPQWILQSHFNLTGLKKMGVIMDLLIGTYIHTLLLIMGLKNRNEDGLT